MNHQQKKDLQNNTSLSFPPSFWNQYNLLKQKRQQETLNPIEQQELINLFDQLEIANATECHLSSS